jgi:hypothetical protein
VTQPEHPVPFERPACNDNSGSLSVAEGLLLYIVGSQLKNNFVDQQKSTKREMVKPKLLMPKVSTWGAHRHTTVSRAQALEALNNL